MNTPDANNNATIRYAELHCLSNFSFLRGASHPEELVERAAELGYVALAITDRNSLAGVVRAHQAAKEHGLHLLIGAEIAPVDAPRSVDAPPSINTPPSVAMPSLVLLATNRLAYARLARLLTRGKLRSPKGECAIYLDDIAELSEGLIAIVSTNGTVAELQSDEDTASADVASAPRGRRNSESDFQSHISNPQSLTPLLAYKQIFPSENLFLAAELRYDLPDDARLARLAELSRRVGIPLVATNNVHYHIPERRYLQDVLTCIREQCTLTDAGRRLFPNAERHLRPLDEIARRYAGYEAAVARTVEIAKRCTFSLDELRYEYPHEVCPPGVTPMEHLERLTWAGAVERYSDAVTKGRSDEVADNVTLPRSKEAPRSAVDLSLRHFVTPSLRHLSTLPDNVRKLITAELQLIAELKYEHYFLTVHDIVRFARSRGILCQGRGSAANSAVCYCLGITAVDPTRIDLLFERFISRERDEPPDIDVDFEHERREEVFQYIYDKYGRERAALTGEVITYRPRSAVRDVGKALGLSLDIVDALAKALVWSDDEPVPERVVRNVGLDPNDRTIQMLLRLVKQILGFPRHLSQHVGGFVISESPLCEIVPLENAAMPNRTFIEWDKDDIDALGILKVDCLALGMLTAISKCFALLRSLHSDEVTKRRSGEVSDNAAFPCSEEASGAAFTSSLRQSVASSLTDLPPEDPAVYDMIRRADTVGVFQIESRAQMSMLPRLKPRCFYDLVIEVAIVRPGPIQGGMVHPYLRRRAGIEPVAYPSEAVKQVLAKTLGVPLFQEQVMRLAVVGAGFTPGEADQLRRAMAAWRRTGKMQQFQLKLIKGMLKNGYGKQFAEQIYKQISGFAEYGFPESHAASFALLVYASAWLKYYHPAAFCAALLNSQPLGFYTPGQLVRDALAHGVPVLPVDVNFSDYDCTLEIRPGSACEDPPIRARSVSEGPPTGARNASEGHRAVAGANTDEEPRALARAVAMRRNRGPRGLKPAALRLGMRLVRGLSEEKARGILAARRKARQNVAHASSISQTAIPSVPQSLNSSLPIASLRQLALRNDVSRETLLRLAAADAFRSLGLNRRQALWRILSLDNVQSSLFAELDPKEPSVALPKTPIDETVVQDYDAIGFSLTAHPIGLVRQELSALRFGSSAECGSYREVRVSPNCRLKRMRNRQRVVVAGLVTLRQRPLTAKGITFMTLEDETGMANLVIRPKVWDEYRSVARSKVALLVEGVVERQGEVVHVVARRLHDLSDRLRRIRHKSRDFC